VVILRKFQEIRFVSTQLVAPLGLDLALPTFFPAAARMLGWRLQAKFLFVNSSPRNQPTTHPIQQGNPN
jgi:hypothetical protein